MTPLAGSMEKHVLVPLVFRPAESGLLKKPVLTITITDGEPTDSPRIAILHVIMRARKKLEAKYGPKAVAFQFAQVSAACCAQPQCVLDSKNHFVLISEVTESTCKRCEFEDFMLSDEHYRH